MLTLTVAQVEFFDEEKNEFVLTGGYTIELEHSLASLSKWESIYEKPFLGEEEKTTEEALGYIRTMIVTPEVPDDILEQLTDSDLEKINEYMNAKMTATWFRETPNGGPNREVITSELVYFWMMSLGIDIACEHWHLARLFTLIRVFHAKNSKPQKMGADEAAAERRRLNELRKKQLGTTG